ncbi:hypothetical protein [Vogesella sp. LIG4]|uniref:hypothetical protein n=1 Tax=Vogesella sp. LIG4 TaxID=1192162 RepID=UPI000B5B09AF|nr:hypothetical protein [Vogesella sp. LIG4]
MKPLLSKRALITLAGILVAALGYMAIPSGISMPMAPADQTDSTAKPATAPTPLVPAAVPQPAPAAAQGSPDAVPAAHDKLASLRPRMSPDSAHDPFTVLSWLPPPPPPPPAPVVQPPPPTAPPLPFAFVGAFDTQSGKPHVFLSNGDRLLVVASGDLIDEQYRVDSIAASNVELTYLPLNQKQVLSTQSEGK